MKIKIVKLDDGLEVHFEASDTHSSIRFEPVIVRFCLYCGSDKIEKQKGWPMYNCLNCGLNFHDSTTQQSFQNHLKFMNEKKA